MNFPISHCTRELRYVGEPDLAKRVSEDDPKIEGRTDLRPWTST